MFRYWLLALTILLLLADAESNYYEDIFSYAMETVPNGKSYQWQTASGASGTLLIQAEFPSKSSTTCRPYAESFVIAGQEGTASGYGCRRVGREGWCRILQTRDAPVLSCALEKSPTEYDRKKLEVEQGVQRGKEIGKGVLDSITK
jgi:hypothetical protein